MNIESLVIIAIFTLCGEPTSSILYDTEEDTRIQTDISSGDEQYHAARVVLLVQPQNEIKLEEETGLKCS